MLIEGDQADGRQDCIDYGSSLKITVQGRVDSAFDAFTVSINIFDISQQMIEQNSTWFSNFPVSVRNGRFSLQLTVDKLILNPGKYFVSAVLHEREHRKILAKDHCNTGFTVSGDFVGNAAHVGNHHWLYENLLQRVIPDVFIHTWSNTGISHKEADAREADETVCEEILQELYSPVAMVIEGFKDGYTDQIGSVSVPETLRENEPMHYRGTLPMYYKMHECNNLKRAHEQDNDFRYDRVIRLRPDLALKQQLPDELYLDDEKLWQSDYMITPSFQVSDKFTFGSSRVLDYYTSVYMRLSGYWKNPLGEPEAEKNHRVGERLMKHHMDVSGIKVETFSIDCELLRVEQVV